jgi:hypothetical protein
MKANELQDSTFVFNPQANGGEEVSLTTKIFSNGDSGDINQQLSLQSYGNSATISLSSDSMTPQILRKLADGLEVLIAEAKELVK